MKYVCRNCKIVFTVCTLPQSQHILVRQKLDNHKTRSLPLSSTYSQGFGLNYNQLPPLTSKNPMK